MKSDEKEVASLNPFEVREVLQDKMQWKRISRGSLNPFEVREVLQEVSSQSQG